MSEVKVTTVETEERQQPLSVFLNGARLAASPLVDLPVQTPKTARLVWNSFTAPADAKLIQQLIDDDLLQDSSERRKWARRPRGRGITPVQRRKFRENKSQKIKEA